MSLNGKLASSKEIVLNVLRDNDYKGQDFRYGDALMWIVEAVSLIGAPQALVNRLACIDIQDHRGLLPCDLHTVIQTSGLLGSGVQFPMRGATNTFHPLFLPNPNSVGIVNPDQPISYDANGNPIFNFLNYDGAISKQLVNALPYTYKDITYSMNENFIFTSFKDGAKVLMSYKAYPVDDCGFPLIPDNIKFKQAIQSYIRMKMDYRMWRKGKLDDKVYNHSEREWAWYCGAATTAANIPSMDEMESLKQQWMHLIPRLNEHSKMFDLLGAAEFITNGQEFYRY